MRREKENSGRKPEKKGYSASVTTGAVALVFLIIGFQAAMFVHKAAVTAIVNKRDRPDTVYVVDRKLAEQVLGAAVQDRSGTGKVTGNGSHAPSGTGGSASGSGFADREDTGDYVIVKKPSEHSMAAKAVYRANSVRKVENFHFDPNTVSLAARMVEYRARLGGSYSYKEQLMDIWKFDKEKYDALSDLITVDSAYIRPYPLWTLPEDSLRLHPYIGSYAAHGIVLFRDSNPSSSWSVDALAGAGVLRSEDAARLSRCIIAGP